MCGQLNCGRTKELKLFLRGHILIHPLNCLHGLTLKKKFFSVRVLCGLLPRQNHDVQKEGTVNGRTHETNEKKSQ